MQPVRHLYFFLTGILLAGLLSGGSARGQGVVLSSGGRPLKIKRVRALLVFQERTRLSYASNQPNRQDLLVELELSEPAPGNARWLIACPGTDSLAQNADRAVMDELSSHWQVRSNAEVPEDWPAEEQKRLEVSAVDKSGLPAELAGILDGSKADWKVYSFKLPAGIRRLGPVRVVSYQLAAQYPGAFGATASETADGDPRWQLPPTELMVAHSHFINVTDNSRGLQPYLGLKKVYQDAGTLDNGEPIWATPKAGYGEKSQPARMNVKSLPAVESFFKTLGARWSLWLTVVLGVPGNGERGALDFMIYSHYPSAVEPVEILPATVTLAVTLVVLVVLARYLFKKKGFVE